MGFWGKLGAAFSIAGPIAASFIPGGSIAAKVAKGALGIGGLAVGGALAGKKAADELKKEDPNAKLLQEQGSKMFGQANPAFGQALDTYGKLAGGDKGTLASFTGTGVNELNRAASNQIQRAKSTMSRGGAESKVLAEAPGQLERSALALRSDARSGALDKLGSLGLAGSQAGNQAIGQAGQLGLARRQQNIGISGELGEGVGSILGKTGVWDKLGGMFGDIVGNKGGGIGGVKPPGVPEFPNVPLNSSPTINLDLFGAKPTSTVGDTGLSRLFGG